MTRASASVAIILLLCQVLFDVIVLDWRNLIVEFYTFSGITSTAGT